MFWYGTLQSEASISNRHKANLNKFFNNGCMFGHNLHAQDIITLEEYSGTKGILFAKFDEVG